jgi:hypothetical protein
VTVGVGSAVGVDVGSLGSGIVGSSEQEVTIVVYIRLFAYEIILKRGHKRDGRSA